MSTSTHHDPAGVLAVGIDSVKLIKNVGVLGAFAVVFAESGLLIGFFLPGDSLLFSLGLLRATKPDLVTWPIGSLCVGLFLAAVLGDQTGYMIGKRLGPKLFEREDSRLFRPFVTPDMSDQFLIFATQPTRSPSNITMDVKPIGASRGPFDPSSIETRGRGWVATAGGSPCSATTAP